MNLNDLFTEEKVRLDPKCWTGKKIGNPKTKMKGGVRVNNCVPAESVNEMDKSQTPPGRDGSNDSDAGKKEYTAKATTAKKVAKDAEKILNKELNKKQGVSEGALSEKINPKTLTRGFVQEKDMGWYTLQAVGDFASRMADEPPTMEIYAMLKPEAGKRDGKQIGQLSLKIAQGIFLKNNPGAEALVAGGVDVDSAYQRKGVASSMYAFAKELGNDVIASVDQSDDAVAMWKGMQAQGVAEEYELAGVGVAYELGRRAYKQGMTIRDNPYSATREARKNDEWAKGLERGKHDANDARHFRSSVKEQGVAEKLGDNRPKLGNKRDAGKSVRKWRSAHGLDETGVAEGDLDEGWKEKLGGAALAGAIALGAGGANARVMPGDDPSINRLTGKPIATQQATDTAPTQSTSSFSIVKPQAQYDVDTQTLTYKGKQYKWNSDARATGQGEVVTAPSMAVGSRSMGSTKVELNPNGTYTRAPANESQEKVGDMDADKFDAAMARLKQLAGAGPLKTVYDPQKRVYRNVPTAQQPKK